MPPSRISAAVHSRVSTSTLCLFLQTQQHTKPVASRPCSPQGRLSLLYLTPLRRAQLKELFSSLEAPGGRGLAFTMQPVSLGCIQRPALRDC